MTDIIVFPEGPLVRGSDRRAAIRSRPGGSGANQAVWLGAMGVPVKFAARVGSADRTHLEAHFRSWGVEALLAADNERPSGVLVTIVDPDGERSFLTDRGANLSLSSENVPDTLLDGARYVVVSGYSFFAPSPRATVGGVMAAARARKITTVVDPASAGFLREVCVPDFLGWTAGTDLLFANREEAEILSGTSDLGEQMQILGQRYARVVIKLGADGAASGTRNGVELALGAPRVDVVDSSGAGDAFAAGYLAAELGGMPAEDCLAAGIEAGSRAVQTVGAQPGR
jgi:sugar/nucleoside kinase (ribokinase family)